MLQNESADEELEHFEDIVEEPEAVPEIEAPKQPENTDKIIPNGNNDLKSDSGTSSDSEVKDDSVSSDSDVSDGGDDFLRKESVSDDSEFKTATNGDKDKPSLSNVWSSLPGNYDPRHREPSYWYLPVNFQ